MKWSEIVAMDESALNLAIEALEGRVWRKETPPSTGQSCWQWQEIYSTVPHLHTTAHWERCMPLLWRYNIRLTPLWNLERQRVETWVADIAHMSATRYHQCSATTEDEARIGICRLALYAATNTKEELHVSPTG